MTLPVSGPISARAINVEFGRDPARPLPLGDAAVRAYCGIASGPVGYASFYGKSSFAASGRNGSVSGVSSSTGSSFYQCAISVVVTGAVNPTFSWVLTSAAGTTLTYPNSQTAYVGRTVTKNGIFLGTAVAQCTVTDPASGRQIVVGNITAQFDIESYR